MTDGAELLTVVDLALGEGDDAAQRALRDDIARDPLLAIEMAETVALLESLRQLRVEPSARFACQMHDVVRRAERHVPAPARPHWLVGAAWLAAAAALVFAVLWSWDPLGYRAAAREERCAAVEPPPASDAGAPTADGIAVGTDAGAFTAEESRILDPATAEWERAIESMRQRLALEPSRRLGEAFEEGLRPPADALLCWLDPQNALASLRAGHELCARTEVRHALLQRRGGLVAGDVRVQDLAERIARELQLVRGGLRRSDVAEVALAVRALIAAGPVDALRSDALSAGGDWLAEHVPAFTGTRLVTAMAALVEMAAIGGDHSGLVARHGARLVDEVVAADPDTWGRRRPALLGGSVDAATMGDAARVVRFLPGFGVDPARCHVVRQLLLGRMRERRDAGDDGPELLAAMLYGCADLLGAGERGEIERQLRRWTPLGLAPDFVTVHQFAWGLEPARVGYTRLQRELRRLAVLPDPGALLPRAAYCLCMATAYAAWPGGAMAALAGGQ